MVTAQVIQYNCERCNVAFANESELVAHRQWRHGGGFRFESGIKISNKNSRGCTKGSSATRQRVRANSREARWVTLYGTGTRLGGRNPTDILMDELSLLGEMELRRVGRRSQGTSMAPIRRRQIPLVKMPELDKCEVRQQKQWTSRQDCHWANPNG